MSCHRRVNNDIVPCDVALSDIVLSDIVPCDVTWCHWDISIGSVVVRGSMRKVCVQDMCVCGTESECTGCV